MAKMIDIEEFQTLEVGENDTQVTDIVSGTVSIECQAVPCHSQECQPTASTQDGDTTGYTVQEMVEKLELSKRTVFRYVKHLINTWYWLPETDFRVNGLYTEFALQEALKLKATSFPAYQESVHDEYAETIQEPSQPEITGGLALITQEDSPFAGLAVRTKASERVEILQGELELISEAADEDFGDFLAISAELEAEDEAWTQQDELSWQTLRLLQAEKNAMQQLDFPYFSVYSDSIQCKIEKPDSTFVCKELREDGYRGLLRRLQKMSDSDLEKQIAMIQGSLYSSITSNHNPNELLFTHQHTSTKSRVPVRKTEELITLVLRITEELRNRAIHSDDGSLAWMGLTYLIKAQRFQFQPLGFDLYSGTCGVSLFLAALAHITGDYYFYDLSIGSIKPLQQVLQNQSLSQRLFDLIGIGGADGCGSIIYALVRISEFLGNPLILEDARKVLCFMSFERIRSEQNVDILGGLAGAILGLLSLYRVTGDFRVLDLAVACGESLISKRVVSSYGCRTWADTQGRLLTGFSHGAAGISYSLLCLYGVTNDVAFLEVAEEGIAYENRVYSQDMKNWPDFRSEKIYFPHAWCNGSIGIGLARLGGLAFLDTVRIRKDIDIALESAKVINFQGVDTLCCGNFGKIDLLVTAAQKLDTEELLDIAFQKTFSIINRASERGSFSMLAHLPKNVYSPHLFQGIAGIGYELLRVAYPNLLPSVLLLE